MSTETPNLHLEYVDPSQSQPEVKINDAWDKIDAAYSGLTVEDLDSPHTTVPNVRTLKFSGATVTEESNNSVLIEVTGGGGGGSVTSLGLTSNATYIAQAGTASPITSTGTYTLDLSVGAKASLALANTALQAAVTSVGLTVNATYIAIGGTASPITSTGAFTLDLSTAAKANLALAATALQTVSVTNSITGNGAGTALKLSGDSATPGNSFYYGTNASGVKGWYSSTAAPGTINITDGTNSVANVTTLTVVGGKISGTSPNATLNVSGEDVPSTIPDMVYWLKGDVVAAKVSSGFWVPVLPNFLPFWNGDFFVRGGGTSSVPHAKNTGVTLNSLGTITFAGLEQYVTPASGPTVHNPAGGFIFKECTVFAVVNATAVRSSANGYSIFTGGGANALEVRLAPSGAVSMNDGTTTVTGTTGLVANATWLQFNAKYAAGAQTFRVGRAAGGTGASTLTLNQGSNALLWFNTSGSFVLNFVGSVAEIIIYDRALNTTEVGNVEAYLLAKWGV